jgi:hypothetical protein
MYETQMLIYLDFDPDMFLEVLQEIPKSRYDAAVQRYLRKYVDPWLDSAMLKDGSESPADRSFAPPVKRRLFSDIDWDELKVERCFEDFCRENSWDFHFPAGARQPELKVVAKSNGPKQRARRLVVGFLSSELKYRVAKCRKCARYFIHKGQKKSYKNGIFCSAVCRNQVSAPSKTMERRRYFRERVIRWAAEAYLQLEPKYHAHADIKKLKREIASRVNQRIIKSGDPRLKSTKPRTKDQNYLSTSWITRNWNKIDVEAKEMGNGQA